MVNVIKASGESAPFDIEKVRRSLQRVGTDPGLVDEIAGKVALAVTEGMSTRVIYRMAFKLLRGRSKSLVAKFHLKRAILKLGTSGFPFERYFGEILISLGMTVELNKIMPGRCINHEVDVFARHQDEVIVTECKYHNLQGTKTDVKVPLYFKSRLGDLRQAALAASPNKLAGSLVTNTRFTGDAEKYGLCAGIRLVGWDFPKKGSLKEMIETSGLYPVTCITSFTKTEISQLLADKIVLCKTIFENPNLLAHLHIPPKRKTSILEQCHTLCSHAQGGRRGG